MYPILVLFVWAKIVLVPTRAKNRNKKCFLITFVVWKNKTKY
jgi:hypothetical protein